MSCSTCGQAHARCKSHRRDGQPCAQYRMNGQMVCKMHGGKNPAALAKAAARVAEQRAAAEVARLGVRKDVHPAEVLLDLVHWTAGEVDYWRQRVAQIEDADLTWGTTRVKEGGDDRGTTHEAKPHVAYSMLERSSDRLAQYAAAALKAGVDERRVRLAETQGALVADVIRRILTRLQLTEDQAVLVNTVVPEELRALAKHAA